MKLWPFQSSPVERRAVDYTDTLAELILSAASGESAASASVTSTANACAALWSGALSAAMVSPDDGIVSRDFLASVGNDIILGGSSVWAIDVDIEASPMVRLMRASSWDVAGGRDPRSWRYALQLPAPSGTVSRTLPSATVLHFVWKRATAEPWRGVGPLDTVTASALALLDTSIKQESSTPNGHIITLPIPGDDENLTKLKTGLASLKGKLGFVETTAAGYSEGQAAAPPTDYEPKRLGPQFNVNIPTVRGQLTADVAAACGVAALISADTDGTSRRASYRDFLTLNVKPTAERIADELTLKLDRDVRLTFDHLTAADTILTRSRSLGQLVKAGMSIDDAKATVGL